VNLCKWYWHYHVYENNIVIMMTCKYWWDINVDWGESIIICSVIKRCWPSLWTQYLLIPPPLLLPATIWHGIHVGSMMFVHWERYPCFITLISHIRIFCKVANKLPSLPLMPLHLSPQFISRYNAIIIWKKEDLPCYWFKMNLHGQYIKTIGDRRIVECFLSQR
jgi:hypothetical protein